MTTGRSDIVDVTLTRRAEREKAIAFWQGDRDDTGREVWVWLPISQIEIDGPDHRGATVTVSLPEWLAKDKELI